LTPAARTISIPRERTTADLLPLEFANAKDVSVNPPSRTVADYLPDDFRPKITATKDRSFVARTKAAATIKRPSDIDFKDQEAAQQLPKATTTQALDKTNSNRQAQLDVNLRSPKKPAQYGDQLYTGQI
jgi:hypothetical protein